MASADERRPYEILEHTADIGLRAHGDTLGQLFENAAWGLAEILDVDRRAQVIGAAAVNATPVPAPMTRARKASPRYAPPPHRIVLDAIDVEGLLVDWMNELILLTEEGRACIAGLNVQSVAGTLNAQVDLVDCDSVPEGTELKAATYHQLSVQQTESGWEATVFFDV